MNKFYSYPITLNVDDPSAKRLEILHYFKTGYALFESLFDLLKNDDVFYKKSEPTRHPMIFYFGHTAVFYINKLLLAGVITKRINPHFESIFAIGVDEMNWDDLDSSRYSWPSVQEVIYYRIQVKSVVENLIMTLPLHDTISQDDPFWIILMGCEHERIHIETSSVLHRQMDLEYIKDNCEFPICSFDNPLQTNSLITINTQEIQLGKSTNHHLYGWDNEYGNDCIKVETFQASQFLVSNGEYLEFVNDGGYTKLEYWDEEGKEFLKNKQPNHPVFWVLNNQKYYLRTLTKLIPMPYSWPVEVNCLEAKAFCKWKSLKENISYTLPSEAQFYALYNDAKLEDIPNFDDTKANINLRHFASSVPVDQFRFANGFYDVVGNVWQHTITPIYPFNGFKVHPIYDDFSVPTFDNLHNLIKGGSWISTGNEMMKHSRYAFRRHFYQHAGFRYVVGSKLIDTRAFNESDDFIDQEIEKHYNSDQIIQIYRFIAKRIQNQNFTNGLEIGCSVGRGSFEIANYIEKLTSIDTTARIIQEALKQKSNYNNPNNVEFWQADPCNMKPIFNGYDLIIINDIFSRVYNSAMLLEDLKNRCIAHGTLIIVSQKQDDLALLHKDFQYIDTSEVNGMIVSRWQKI
ncbi:MAG: 5-histidylcysteine sulfoxide synthase [Campylobacterales bacterium]|nr:5-histidylcysteine sulfoxide synthase [Campylobacterales bacterium]